VDAARTAVLLGTGDCVGEGVGEGGGVGSCGGDGDAVGVPVADESNRDAVVGIGVVATRCPVL
jgi:hypothetical protein